jgi:hypothetical protein
VNFPRLLYDWKLGLPLHETVDYQVGKRLRWLWGDLRNLHSVFTKGPQPDGPSRTSATLTFVRDFVRKDTCLDLIDMDDIVPGVLELKGTVQDGLRVFAWPIRKPAREAKG